MKVGLLADTHDRLPAIAELLRRFQTAGVTMVLHAGDFCAPFALRPFAEAKIPLVGVFGRNDGDREGLIASAAALPAGGELFESPHSVDIGGRTILLVHDISDVLARSLDSHAFVIHGCSHQTEMKTRGDTLLLNPGEGCGWLSGAPTGAVLDLDAHTVEVVKLTDYPSHS
ncbi:MAG: metallophosphoesterase [Gemmatirosa sp.]|nr:metallophosphoesterase [Gemmatirosa sp.]